MRHNAFDALEKKKKEGTLPPRERVIYPSCERMAIQPRSPPRLIRDRYLDHRLINVRPGVAYTRNRDITSSCPGPTVLRATRLSREFPRVVERSALACCLVLPAHTSTVSPRQSGGRFPKRSRNRRPIMRTGLFLEATESTDILIIFYSLVTTRLWQPSNGGAGRGEDSRRSWAGFRERGYLRWLET